MRSRAWTLGLLVTLGCSSEAVTQGSAQTSGNPSDTGAPSDTTTAPTVAGDFTPMEAYPTGPYGHGAGSVIENLEFLGWRDPVAAGYDPAQLDRVKLGDFYDPSGEQTEIIVLNAMAVWCTVCQAELRDMHASDTYAKYHARKVQILGTLFEDSSGNPAKPSDLVLWGSSQVRQIAFPLVLDPALKMGVYFTSDATPLNLVIDARTMKIIDVMMGYDSTPGSGLWGTVDAELQSRGL